MRRTNTFVIAPDLNDEECLRRLLDASASFWNELTYERRQRLFAGDPVWEGSDCGDRYKSRLGAATVQTVRRVNDEAWRSFFERRKEHSTSPPGYWGNQDDGRDLRVYLRNDTYTIEWGSRSRIDLLIGQKLKEEFGLGYRERLRLPVRGVPRWNGTRGRLVINYDEVAKQYRAYQSVAVNQSALETSLGETEAAVDIGANNLVACSTSGGSQYLFEGRPLFDQYRVITEHIAVLAGKLPERRRSSRRIKRLYRKRTRQRNHAQDALVRTLVKRLHAEGVATVFVGDLTDIVTDHWCVKVNQKTHSFWAHHRFTDRLSCVSEEYGIDVREVSEAWTSQRCPRCGVRENTVRDGDSFYCQRCQFRGHADLVGARNILAEHASGAVRPMARPVRFQWDNHQWRSTTDAPAETPTNSARTCELPLE